VAICFSEIIALALEEAMPTMTHAADAEYLCCSSFKKDTSTNPALRACNQK
jgi:hypothetical protein